MIPLLLGLAGAGVGVKLALDSMNPMVPPSAHPSSLPHPDQIQKFADSPGEWWNEGTPRPGQPAKPADARLVPILPATTVLLPGTTVKYWYTSKATLLAALAGLRQVLHNAGRGDEDARAVMCRCAIETAWGRACQRNAWGNVKKHTWTSRARILTDHQVWTNTPEAEGVHLLVDHSVPPSFDSYSSFATAEDYFRFQARFLDHSYGTIPAIAGAREGYRLGGVEGCVASERRLQWGAGESNEPYAGSSAVPRAVRVAAAERQARSFWNLCVTRATAAEWVRGS